MAKFACYMMNCGKEVEKPFGLCAEHQEELGEALEHRYVVVGKTEDGQVVERHYIHTFAEMQEAREVVRHAPAIKFVEWHDTVLDTHQGGQVR